MKSLVARDSTNLDWRLDLAHSYNSLGVVQAKLGDLRAALASHRAEIAIKEALVAHDPSHRQRQRYLAHAYVFLGNLLVTTGEVDSALPHLRRAREIYASLVAQDTSNTLWRRNLANASRFIGQALLERGDARGALASITESRAELERLVAASPANRAIRHDASMTAGSLARALLGAGQTTAALAAARRAVDLERGTPGRVTLDIDERRVLGDAYLTLGEVATRAGETEAARRAWTSALETVDSTARATRQTDLLALQTVSLLDLDRLDDARPVVSELLRRGYRRPGFVTLVRTKGLATDRP
jgi:tetratricopeptide (TPR) repeat protein